MFLQEISYVSQDGVFAFAKHSIVLAARSRNGSRCRADTAFIPRSKGRAKQKPPAFRPVFPLSARPSPPFRPRAGMPRRRLAKLARGALPTVAGGGLEKPVKDPVEACPKSMFPKKMYCTVVSQVSAARFEFANVSSFIYSPPDGENLQSRLCKTTFFVVQYFAVQKVMTIFHLTIWAHF